MTKIRREINIKTENLAKYLISQGYSESGKANVILTNKDKTRRYIIKNRVVRKEVKTDRNNWVRVGDVPIRNLDGTFTGIII